ncbi:hypothetical protein K1719_027621 [Acacia pycnantha]|nr:hypothetical protein K1719_027621 [Acacia pycnantha]
MRFPWTHSKPLDLTGIIDLVELEDRELDLLLLVLDLLGLGVDLLLSLLSATTESEHQMEGKDETLLVRRDSFLVLNVDLDIVDGVGRLNLEGYRLPR